MPKLWSVELDQHLLLLSGLGPINSGSRHWSVVPTQQLTGHQPRDLDLSQPQLAAAVPAAVDSVRPGQGYRRGTRGRTHRGSWQVRGLFDTYGRYYKTWDYLVQYFFCSASWVRPISTSTTFLSPAHLINLSIIKNILVMLRVKPWAAGWEARMLPLCHAALPPPFTVLTVTVFMWEVLNVSNCFTKTFSNFTVIAQEYVPTKCRVD